MTTKKTTITSSRRLFERRKQLALLLIKFISSCSEEEVLILKPLLEACLKVELELQESREEVLRLSSKNNLETIQESLRIEENLCKIRGVFEEEDSFEGKINSLKELEELVLTHKKLYGFLIYLTQNCYSLEAINSSVSKILENSGKREWNIEMKQMMDAIEFVELLNKERSLIQGIKDCFKTSYLFPSKVIPHKFS